MRYFSVLFFSLTTVLGCATDAPSRTEVSASVVSSQSCYDLYQQRRYQDLHDLLVGRSGTDGSYEENLFNRLRLARVKYDLAVQNKQVEGVQGFHYLTSFLSTLHFNLRHYQKPEIRCAAFQGIVLAKRAEFDLFPSPDLEDLLRRIMTSPRAKECPPDKRTLFTDPERLFAP